MFVWSIFQESVIVPNGDCLSRLFITNGEFLDAESIVYFHNLVGLMYVYMSLFFKRVKNYGVAELIKDLKRKNT